jgi:hypothetical protein
VEITLFDRFVIDRRSEPEIDADDIVRKGRQCLEGHASTQTMRHQVDCVGDLLDIKQVSGEPGRDHTSASFAPIPILYCQTFGDRALERQN